MPHTDDQVGASLANIERNKNYFRASIVRIRFISVNS